MNGLGPFASLYDINFPDIKNPFLAFYYMKENKGRTFLCIFMMVLATFMFLAGNYIHSELYNYVKTLAGDKRVQISESQRNIGFAVCEVLIIVPLILSKGRLMSRADVTEF